LELTQVLDSVGSQQANNIMIVNQAAGCHYLPLGPWLPF